MKTAFLFPGQGAQTVGMGADIADAFPACGAVFDRANDILGYDLKRLCFEGPESQLDSTTVSQPAIFVTSAAILSLLRGDRAVADIAPDVTAGLSLGEYTALYAAGAMTFEQALVLVQKRGQAMQAAAEATRGGMVSIIGLDADAVQAVCDEAAEGQLLKPANFNCPGQIVISGRLEACDRAVEAAQRRGAVKAVKLKVAGAFHTEMMSPAADALAEALAASAIKAPEKIRAMANVDAAYYTDAGHVRRGLVRQLVEPILWQKCMERLLDEDVEAYYEIGPGRVLTGLMKRINRKAKVVNVSDLSSIRQLRSQPVGNEWAGALKRD